MVKELYSLKGVEDNKHLVNRTLRWCVTLGLICVLICVVICRFVSRENAHILQILTIMCSTFGGWIVLYQMLNIIIPRFNREKHIIRLLNSDRNTYIGVVLGVYDPITIAKDMTVHRLEVESEGKILLLYWDIANELPDFASKVIRFEVVRHQIVAWEVQS